MTLATQLLIDGRLIGAEASLHVVDPGRGIPFISVPRGSRADATVAVTAAKKASAGWAAMPIAERQKLPLQAKASTVRWRGQDFIWKRAPTRSSRKRSTRPRCFEHSQPACRAYRCSKHDRVRQDSVLHRIGV